MIGKLLVLLAVLAMPLGMSAAGASAATAHDGAMEKAHCPDSDPAGDVEPGIAACNMVCAAALPAIGPSAEETPTSRQLPQPARSNKMPPSILLETATPPPRLA